MSLTSPFACSFVGMAAAFPIVVVAVVGHSKVVAGPTVADHIAMVAIEVGPPAVAHIVAEVALVAIVDYP